MIPIPSDSNDNKIHEEDQDSVEEESSDKKENIGGVTFGSNLKKLFFIASTTMLLNSLN